MLRTLQNDKEEGARATKLETCGIRGPLGRGPSVLSARKAPIVLPMSHRRL